MGFVSELQSKILTRSSTPEEYKVYQAGLEWDVVDPIVIQGSNDLKSEKSWRDRVTPYHHQVTNLITFCRRLSAATMLE